MPKRKNHKPPAPAAAPAAAKSINDMYLMMTGAAQKEIALVLKKYNLVMHVEHVIQLRPKPQ